MEDGGLVDLDGGAGGFATSIIFLIFYNLHFTDRLV